MTDRKVELLPIKGPVVERPPPAREEELHPFEQGYLAALRDFEGGHTSLRTTIIYADRRGSAQVAREQWEDGEGDWLADVVQHRLHIDERRRRVTGMVAPRRRPARTGTIYAFRDDAGARFKIGWTQGSPLRRMRAIEKVAGCALVVAGTMSGTMADERSAHARLGAHRLVGEWFSAAPEVVAWVGEMR